MRAPRSLESKPQMTEPRSNRKVLVLPGDGIGPEIMGEVMRVVEFFDRRRIASFDVSEGLVGGAAYDASGVPLTDATMAEAMAADAVLFGSVGGPKWETLPFELQPERGLLRLRKDMDLFANLRPAVVFEALADASSPEARSRRRARPDDRARTDRRHLFRRAPRHRDPARRHPPRHQHRSLHRGRDRARRARRLRSRPQAAAPPHRGRQGQCDGIGRAVARGCAAGARRLPGCRAFVHVCRQLRDAARARPEAVRCHRHQQSVRRYSFRLRGDADGIARHAALGLAWARRMHPAGAGRSTSRCMAAPPTLPARASRTRWPASSPSR